MVLPACRPFLTGSSNLDYDDWHGNESMPPLVLYMMDCVAKDLAVGASVHSCGSVTSGDVLLVTG